MRETPEMDMPDQIYADRDPETNEKRWYNTKGMGTLYTKSDWSCAARRAPAGFAGETPPDCDWPFCGCDPYASKVIEALQESGVLK